jgi:hypothetical protein
MMHYSDKQHGDTLSPTEPVAWLDVDDQGTYCGLSFYTVTGREVPLYTAPQPQREWVGIAPNEVVSELERVGYEGSEALIFALGAAWAEQRVREKNGCGV